MGFQGSQGSTAPSRFQALRLALAGGLFAAVVVGAVITFVVLPRGKRAVAAAEREALAAAGGQSDDEGQFFYDAVGRAPQGFEDAVPSAGQSRSGKVSYTLEIRVAKGRSEAERLIDQLHDQGIEAYYTPLTRAGHVVYRVRRGLYPSQKDADRAALAMRTEHAITAQVVRLQ